MATPLNVTRAACGAACVNTGSGRRAGHCYPLRAGRYPPGAALFEDSKIFFF
jgi:hypothetical protein